MRSRLKKAQSTSAKAERGERIKQLEDQLRKFRLLLAAVPDFIYQFDLEGRFTYISRSLLDLWGRTYQESVGKNFHQLDYPPELATKLQRQIQEVITSQRALRDETPYASAAGSRQYEYLFFPLINDEGRVDGVGGVTRDITDRKRTEQTLDQVNERFRLLVEGTPDYAMFLLDPDNRITYWSSGAEKIFGWTPGEAVGRTGDLIFTPEDKAKGAVEEEIGTALFRGYAPDRRWHLRKNGSRLWVDGVMRRLDHKGGGLRGFAKIARDASDQRAIDDALRHSRDELEQRVLERTRDLLVTNSELERTMAQRKQLEKELLEISEREKRRIGEDLHDIVCQELTATALFLKSTANTAKDPHSAKTLDEAAEIVNRNVALARNLARGFQPVVIGEGGLVAALRNLCKQIRSTKKVICHMKLPRGIRLKDETIALNLYRIAQEAVTNAVKHAGATDITVCMERENGHIRLVVEDNGKGFRPSKRRKGLGLHIMRYRASALGGKLRIAARRKGGTLVVVEVPVKK